MDKRLKYKYHINGAIPELSDTETIFVFGSNLAGLHKLGAALVAKTLFGAQMGNPIGIQGRSYAIPTKDRFIRTLSLSEIRKHVNNFKQFAIDHPEMRFFVTGVGCGLAGYKPYQIAPMFEGIMSNCSFPNNWKPYLK